MSRLYRGLRSTGVATGGLIAYEYGPLALGTWPRLELLVVRHRRAGGRGRADRPTRRAEGRAGAPLLLHARHALDDAHGQAGVLPHSRPGTPGQPRELD